MRQIVAYPCSRQSIDRRDTSFHVHLRAEVQAAGATFRRTPKVVAEIRVELVANTNDDVNNMDATVPF